MNSFYKKILFTVSAIFSVFALSAQITPQEAIQQMQKGINLGNTHEPPKEAGWNNPRAEEYYFDLYKEAGFTCVRIPVRWDGYTGKTAPYKVSDSWLDRIEEVVNWGLERDLFIVINSHHDNWIKENYTEANKARFDSIWSQISVRFKDKSEKLVFEVLNEPHGLTKANNDDMHARVLSIIRKTNPTRLVIFQGNEWGGSNELIAAAIPQDSFLIGSFHTYDPYNFGLVGEGTWGSASDYAALDSKFRSVYNWSQKNNIPVFLGEFGSLRECDFNSRMRHYRAYVELAQKYGFAAIAWDDGGNFRIMERQQRKWDEVKDILIHTCANSPAPKVNILNDSIIRLQWVNHVAYHDNVIIQRRTGTSQVYQEIATLKSDTSSYYDIKPPVNQTYTYRVIAQCSDTTDLCSQPVQVFFPKWTKPVRIPFLGAPMIIPGTIEAEDFDDGGEGLSYHDADELNIPGDYRPDESVDIYDRLGTGFHIGNAIAGEWYEYSVDIQKEGMYEVTAHIATGYNGGQFQISVDTVHSEIVTVTSTHSNLKTGPFTTEMYLYPGTKIMRFTVISNPTFNIDKITFDLKNATGTVDVEIEKPFNIVQNNTGEIVVTHLSGQPINNIEIFSITGSLLKTTNNSNWQTKIQTNDLSPGVYIVRATTAAKQFSKKIVIDNF
jgi:aryl-phospho-beta-D-glucosidase BglC (GH1 family)